MPQGGKGAIVVTATIAEPVTRIIEAYKRDQQAVGLDRLSRLPSPPVVVLTSSGGTVYDEQSAPPYGETDPVAPNGRLSQ